MGFFDNIKKATGVGLTPEQHYDRVYEKAVLLGEENYGKAVELFGKAAAKASEAGDEALSNRALANAALYSFVTGQGSLEDLAAGLSLVSEIEQVGSRSDTMPTEPILAELKARQIEAKAERATGSDAKIQGHTAAARAFKAIFNAPLYTYAYRPSKKHNGHAKDRFFFHTGMVSWHGAVQQANSSPEAAAEHMARALNAFRQCEDKEWTDASQRWLRDCRVSRTCYMCHREFQGAGLHFRLTSADVSPYAQATLDKLGHDPSSLDPSSGKLVLCEPCGTAVDGIADRIAQDRVREMRNELIKVLNERFGQVDGALNALDGRLRRVESIAHRH